MHYLYHMNPVALPSLQEAAVAILKREDTSATDRLQQLCELLREEVPHYNWVGFYFRNGEREELKLGPYAGAATDHTIIPFGRGICGQVAVSNENFVVPNVAAQDNYLACSLDVKAEIVVPVFVKGENIGQIDIDSHHIDPFTKADVDLLEFLAREVAGIL